VQGTTPVRSSERRALNDASAESAEKPSIIFNRCPDHKQDLLAFCDVRALGLQQALQAGRLQPLATAAMLDELADVLSRPFLHRWRVDTVAALDKAHSMCRLVVPLPTSGRPAPRCSDPDDQKFIDLAWAWPATWLFSHDRALLRLARAARPHGLGILTPADWAERASRRP
jgi:predicted nucleic acid-binding protein